MLLLEFSKTSGSIAHLPPGVSPDEVYIQLDRILASHTFGGATRAQDFLRYVVFSLVEDRGKQLKEYLIAVEVFGRKDQ